MDHQTESPQITREDRTGAATIRLRANSKYTQKDGWHPADITVEYTGPADALPANLFRDRTVDLHSEIESACETINRREGR